MFRTPYCSWTDLARLRDLLAGFHEVLWIAGCDIGMLYMILLFLDNIVGIQMMSFL